MAIAARRRLELLIAVLLGSALFIASLLLLATWTSPSRRFQHAHALQQQGKTEAALNEYLALLGRIPAREHQLNSIIETHIGECLAALGRGKDAYDALRKAVTEDPDNTPARLRLAQVALAGSAPEIAVDQAQQILIRDSRSIDALSVLGAAFADEGKAASARATLQQVVNADPTRTTTSIALAEIEAQQNDFIAARQTLQRAAQAAPHDADPLLALGRIEELLGSLPDAEKDYRRAVATENSLRTNLRLAQFLARSARIPEAEQVLAHAPQKNSAQPAALADFDLAAGRTDAALLQYQEKLRGSLLAPATSHESDPRQLVVRIIEAQLQQARQKISAGEDGQPALKAAAAELSAEQNRLDPATLATLQAEFRLAQNDVAGAITEANRAVSLDSQSPTGFYVLALALEAKGDVNAAAQQIQQSLSLDPTFLPARLALARLLYQSGNFRAAESSAADVVLEEPENVEALCLYAQTLAAEGRTNEAMALAQRARAADPASAQPRLILGDIAFAQHRLASALLEYEQAILLEPHSQVAVARLTALYGNSRVNTAMLRQMQHIAASNPPSAPLMEIAGRLYAQRGSLRDARNCLRQALTIDPHSPSAAAALVEVDTALGNFAEAHDAAKMLGASSADLLAGSAAIAHHDTKNAVRNYEQAVRQGDNTGIAANNLAWIYAQEGVQLDRALELATAARQAAPQSPDAADTLGLVHLKRREYSAAISEFRQALLLAGSQSPVSDDAKTFKAHLKQAYLLSGQTDAARALESGNSVTTP